MLGAGRSTKHQLPAIGDVSRNLTTLSMASLRDGDRGMRAGGCRCAMNSNKSIQLVSDQVPAAPRQSHLQWLVTCQQASHSHVHFSLFKASSADGMLACVAGVFRAHSQHAAECASRLLQHQPGRCSVDHPSDLPPSKGLPHHGGRQTIRVSLGDLQRP